jgi:hypothetical protein
MRLALLIALSLATAGCSSPAEKAQETPKSTDQVVQWAAIAGAPRPGPHESRMVDVDLQVTTMGDWHVYSLTQVAGGPTPLTVTVSPPYQLSGKITAPTPVKAKDNNFGIVTETYSGEQIFKFAVELPGTNLELPPIELKIRSQACSDRLCLPAKTTTLTVTPGMRTT